MMFVRTLVLCTKSYNEMTVLTPRVEEIVLESGVQEGMVTVLTRHTTTGVTVNEALECLESDTYCHARMLRDYGSTAGNPTGHLKAMLTGNHCHFLIHGGVLERGGAQDVYFCEFDGPARREILVIVEGE